jgi:hypothetical protein
MAGSDLPLEPRLRLGTGVSHTVGILQLLGSYRVAYILANPGLLQRDFDRCDSWFQTLNLLEMFESGWIPFRTRRQRPCGCDSRSWLVQLSLTDMFGELVCRHSTICGVWKGRLSPGIYSHQH